MGRIVPGDPRQGGHNPGQAVQVFGVDRVPLEGHGRRSDLLAVERLAPLTKGLRLEDSQIKGEFVQRSGQARQRVEHEPILLAGVGLGGYRKGPKVQPGHDLRLQIRRAGSPSQASQELGI